ncbi:MAG: TonB family protein [Methanococcaceae archaeon]
MNNIKNTSYLVSFGFHLLVLVLFIFWKVDINYTPADYVEVGFGNPGGSGGGGSDINKIVTDVNTDVATIPQTGESPKSTEGEKKQTIVSPTAKSVDAEKINVKKNDKPVVENGSKDSKGTGTSEGVKATAKSAAGFGNNPLGSGIGNGRGTGSGNGNGEGDGNGDGYDLDFGGKGSRRIYSYILPKYPDGVSKEIDVKLRFTILPDGTVGTISPLMKSDTRLENAAINSLRQWRFEPLPERQKQIEQTAVIVFPYRLR